MVALGDEPRAACADLVEDLVPHQKTGACRNWMGYFSQKHGQQEGGWLLWQSENEGGAWMAAGQSSSFVGLEKENTALAWYFSVP